MVPTKGGKKSSYFPESVYNMSTPLDSPAFMQEPQWSQEFVQSELAFPPMITILWDRTPIGQATLLVASTAIPSILLVADDVRTILSALAQQTVPESFDLRVTVRHRKHLLETEQAVASRPYTGTPYVCVMRIPEEGVELGGKASCNLTIPVLRSDSERLSPCFEGSSTRCEVYFVVIIFYTLLNLSFFSFIEICW